MSKRKKNATYNNKMQNNIYKQSEENFKNTAIRIELYVQQLGTIDTEQWHLEKSFFSKWATLRIMFAITYCGPPQRIHQNSIETMKLKKRKNCTQRKHSTAEQPRSFEMTTKKHDHWTATRRKTTTKMMGNLKVKLIVSQIHNKYMYLWLLVATHIKQTLKMQH